VQAPPRSLGAPMYRAYLSCPKTHVIFLALLLTGDRQGVTIAVPRYLRGAVDAPAGALGVPGSRSDFLTRGPNGRARAPGRCLPGGRVREPPHDAPRWTRPAPRCPHARRGPLSHPSGREQVDVWTIRCRWLAARRRRWSVCQPRLTTP